MQKTTYSFIAIMLLAVLLIGCSDNREQREQMVAQEKEEYLQKVDEFIMDIDQKIAQIRAEAAEATDVTEETAEEAQKQLNELQHMRDELNGYLGDLRDSSADEWNDFKSKLDQKLAELRHSINGDETI